MKRIFSILLAALLLSGAVPALAANDRAPSSTDPPIISWQPPATYNAAQAAGRTALTGEIGSGPVPFYPVTPCRQYDSRNTSSLLDNTARTIALSGAPCGIPAQTNAIAVNITVFNLISHPGNSVFKVGTAAPPTTAWINYGPTETQRGNAGVVAVVNGNLVVQVNQGAGQIDFVVDVFGYYPDTNFSKIPTGDFFPIWGDYSGGSVLFGRNDQASAANSYGVGGWSASTGTSSAGVYGQSTAASGGVFGVLGRLVTSVSSDSAGVQGRDGTGLPGNGGVTGHITAGVRGDSKSSIGVYGLSNYAAGIFEQYDATGANLAYADIGYGGHGVSAATNSTAADASGITGSDGAGASTGASSFFSAGARFFGKNGVIGFTSTASGDGVVGMATAPATTGVIAFGNLVATGTKPFIEPHPTDPTKEIRFVAMEGPEAGTYFRAKATVLNGVAVVDVPDSFRMVTDPEGLTVHVTPVGRAQTWIESYDLNRIVVGASKDVPVSVIVYGIRHAYRDWQVVSENQVYRPVSPDQTIGLWLSPDAKARLIANGTYNADGTVNMRTAEQAGWAQQWRDEAAAQAKAAQQSNVKPASLPQDR